MSEPRTIPVAFEVGQWYRCSDGSRAEVVAVDTVGRLGGKYHDVVGYRYEGRTAIHLRLADSFEGWALEVPLAVGDEIQSKRTVSGVRLGAHEKRIVTYVSDHRVCWAVHSFDGGFLAEHSATREVFDQDYEKVYP
jgi:hypothetical protein